MRKQQMALEEEEVQKAIPLRIKSDLRKRPYGLCESVGISTSGLSPREAWGEWNAYRKKIDAGERVFLKFTTRPKPQLVYALKRRGWHWNAYEQAWSVPAEKYDAAFVAGIDGNYEKYL